MLTSTADDDVIVYVGEGFSDRCPVQYADVVFAKDELTAWCDGNGVAYYPYRSFADVEDRLSRISPKGTGGPNAGFPRRRRAAVARKDAFLGG